MPGWRYVCRQVYDYTVGECRAGRGSVRERSVREEERGVMVKTRSVKEKEKSVRKEVR